MEKEEEDEEDDIKEEPGAALIKKEFLIRMPKRIRTDKKEASPNVASLSAADAASSVPIEATNGASRIGDSTSSTSVANGDESAKQEGAEKRRAESNEAPSKKMKGQFKNRPVDKSARDPSLKLCNSTLRSEPCPMATCGKTCHYMHDLEAFLATKRPDLGSRCFLFDTHGFCPSTFHCRFGESHKQFDADNLKNKVSFATLEAKLTPNLNNLPKELQNKLRKRKYNFKKADAAWKAVGKELGKSGEIGKWLEKKEGGVKTDGDEETNQTPPEGPLDSMSNGDDAPASIPPVSPQPPAFSTTFATTTPVGSVGPERKSKIRFADKLFLAPLTTVGNLPFRRICKELGADITCGEMAMSTNLLRGQSSEWALTKRHPSEEIFGVQLCGGFPDSMSRICQVLKEQMQVDFIDVNMGCPIDLVFKKGQGSALMNRINKLEQIVRSMKRVLSSDDDYVPLTIKFRTGIQEGVNTAHTLIPKLKEWGVDLMTLHGRSRQQRYTRQADWDYIQTCAQVAAPIPFFGNGDVYSVEEYNDHRSSTNVDGIMIARGALYKPWIFTEIKEQRDWDISASERFDILRKFSNYGLEHWGSDTQGVETTRKFLLEWLSFFYRYIPVGVLERVPHRLNERVPPYIGRNDLETLMASPAATDWVRISEMLLGPTPEGYQFLPKHKANAVATWTSVSI